MQEPDKTLLTKFLTEVQQESFCPALAVNGNFDSVWSHQLALSNYVKIV